MSSMWEETESRRALSAGEEFPRSRLKRWLSTFVDSIFWCKDDVNTSSTQTASEVGTRELNASTACLRCC